ncbi:hypothetical protein UFOVP581_16 [uncultured Caudovirales phage]|uniref:Scaffolding protein n=1 Tax=uncultured Caudovirales phage TaxID=2100421 RepID=A0A6J5PIB1_9CAUD|nr:hypothetical protein UFOVP581_16 [uncultured Caudovirales phage]
MGLDMTETADDTVIDEEQVNDGMDLDGSDTIEAIEPEDHDVIVTIGDEESPPQEDNQAPEWVRELRKANKEDKRRIKELEEKLNATSSSEVKPKGLGKKPTLEDYDYDAEEFSAALSDWFECERQAKEAKAKEEAAQIEQRNQWQAKLDTYSKLKTELKVKDFDDAEALAQDLFNVTQQGIVLQGAENPAVVIYALGKNPAKAKELSTITDPVKFAFAVAKLETQLKVKQRTPPTQPERTVQSSGGTRSGTVDSTLERLREEAAKTGDLTKVIAYKLKNAAK